MSGLSNIEWTDATWNPVTGCTKVSQGCKNCYAEALFSRPYPGRKFTDVRIHPERLDWPLRWGGSPQAKAEGRPSRIFVNSMSDLFHENVEPAFIDKAFAVMALADQHMFQILTKRPERMEAYFNGVRREGMPEYMSAEARIARVAETLADMRGEKTESANWEMFLEQPYHNVWIGVSVEDQKTANERIPLLLQTPAAVRWVSYEPALGPLDLHTIPDGHGGYYDLAYSEGPGHFSGMGMRIGDAKLDWIVAGGESGPRARPPHPDWFRSCRDQCQAAGVPFFFKQWGAYLPAGQDGAKIGRHQEINSGDIPIFIGKKKAGALLDGREWKDFPR
jgi:protein gp37